MLKVVAFLGSIVLSMLLFGCYSGTRIGILGDRFEAKSIAEEKLELRNGDIPILAIWKSDGVDGNGNVIFPGTGLLRTAIWDDGRYIRAHSNRPTENDAQAWTTYLKCGKLDARELEQIKSQISHLCKIRLRHTSFTCWDSGRIQAIAQDSRQKISLEWDELEDSLRFSNDGSNDDSEASVQFFKEAWNGISQLANSITGSNERNLDGSDLRIPNDWN